MTSDDGDGGGFDGGGGGYDVVGGDDDRSTPREWQS